MRTDRRTLTDGLDDLRLGAKFLGALIAIPVAGVFGLPLLVLLLLLFTCNPGGLGQHLGRWQALQNVPGFRAGRRAHMAAASLLYLLPLSLLGMVVVGIDGLVLRVFP